MLFHIFALLSEGGNDISIGIELAGSDSNVITRPDRIIQSWPSPICVLQLCFQSKGDQKDHRRNHLPFLEPPWFGYETIDPFSQTSSLGCWDNPTG